MARREERPEERFPPPGEGEIAWVVDAVSLGEDEAVRTLLESGPGPGVVELARLVSTATALLTYLGRPSFDDVTGNDLTNVALTGEQGDAWRAFPGVLPLLRVTVRGRAKGLKFSICTGCGRWMLVREVPKSKSCPLTLDCTGPFVGVPPGVVTGVAPAQVVP